MIVMEEILISGAREMGITLTPAQVERFAHFTRLLLEWNARMNLTRITDPAEIAVKHYLDSLALLPRVEVAGEVLDVGTGAGIPGIPLAIVAPIRLTVLDSTAKKLSFVQAAAEELGLSVRTVHARAEDAGRDPAHRDRYDLAVSRAVARMPVLAELCMPFCRKGGLFAAYKGPEVDAELSAPFETLGGRLLRVERFTLPDGSARALVLVEKTGRTPPAYPRKAGVPQKEPLDVKS
ncbi:MAG: 16S rRNA (guanine(527)-N(7))-methyltransferase RsmG [Armatimonadota bacterium]